MSLPLGLLSILVALQLPNPATVPVPQHGFEARHADKVTQLKRHKFNLLMIGDSITHNFEKEVYQPIWRQYFKPRNAINLGYSGARTENTIWNLQNGELTGQTPKVAVLLIGTNNADETNYPTHHTAEQIAEGVKVIVQTIHQHSPKTKILMLACFPYGENPSANSRGIVLQNAAKIYRANADNSRVFFLDIGKVFLKADGSMNKDVMPDYLHPNVTGALLWAREMEPMLCKLMGDENRNVPTGG